MLVSSHAKTVHQADAMTRWSGTLVRQESEPGNSQNFLNDGKGKYDNGLCRRAGERMFFLVTVFSEHSKHRACRCMADHIQFPGGLLLRLGGKCFSCGTPHVRSA